MEWKMDQDKIDKLLDLIDVTFNGEEASELMEFLIRSLVVVCDMTGEKKRAMGDVIRCFHKIYENL